MQARVTALIFFIAAIMKILMAAIVLLTGNPLQTISERPTPYAVIFVFLAGAGVLVLAGRRDNRALDLSVVFALAGASFADTIILQSSLSGVVRGLGLVQFEAFIPFFLWRFVGDFPRAPRLLQSRFLRPMLLGSCIAGAVLMLLQFWPAVMPITLRRSPGSLFWTITFILAVPAVPFAWRRSRIVSPEEKRRIGLAMLGIVIGTIPIVIATVITEVSPFMNQFVRRDWIQPLVSLVVFGSLLTMPGVMIYAVVVDEVFDFRFIARKAVQYAFARYTVLLLALTPLVLLLNVFYRNRNETLGRVTTGPPALLLLAIAGTAVALYGFRGRMLVSIDRRFFREHYDAQKVLMNLAESSRLLGHPEKLAQLLVTEIDRAMHLRSVKVMVRSADEQHLVSFEGWPHPLSCSSALYSLLSRTISPLDIHFDRQPMPLAGLGAEDQQWIADSGFRLVVPIPNSEGLPLGLIGLGEKRSELPFSQEDRQLLTGIGAAAGLSLENYQIRQRASEDGGSGRIVKDEPANVCPQCRTIYPATAQSCSACEARLLPAQIPFVLNGKFRLEIEAGRGGMGVVYRGVDITLRRSVALKTLPSVMPEAASRLRREAWAMAAVVHPNLAMIYSVETWRGIPVLVSEFVPAGTLSERLRRSPMSMPEVIELGLALTGVLEKIHSVGILHRDIKPSNIAFCSDGTVKLLDFGLAHLFDESGSIPARRRSAVASHINSSAASTGADTLKSTQPGHIIGTPLYMSPERFLGVDPSPGFDLWSLAVVLYESLCGEHPWGRLETADMLTRLEKGSFPDIETRLPDCPESLSAFFKQALASNPRHRPQTSSDMRALLNTLKP